MRWLVAVVFLATASAVEAGDLVVRVRPLNTAGARAFAPSRVINAVQAPRPVKMDGKLDERCWKRGRWISRFYEAKGKRPAKYPPLTKFAFDRQYLYMAFRCPEKEMDKLRLLRTKRDDSRVWNDDCVEIYLDANHDGASMIHFMINAAGVVTDSKVVEYAEPDAAAGVPGVYVYRRKSDLSWNADVKVGASKGEAEWRLEVRIPARDLGLAEIIPGAVMGVTVCRERYCGPRYTGLASLRPNAWASKIWTYPLLRLGKPVVHVKAGLPACVGRNECRLTLTNPTKRPLRVKLELNTRSWGVSGSISKLSRSVELPPGRPVAVVMPYRILGRRYALSLQGRLADGRMALNESANGATAPAVSVKMVEHTAFVGRPVVRARLRLNLGAVSAAEGRLIARVKDAKGRVVAQEDLPAPKSRETELALNAARLTREGRYTLEAVVSDQGTELGRASGAFELVAPPDYGL